MSALEKRPTTVRALILAYTASEHHQNREDIRHARWWRERMGDEELTDLSLETILTKLEQLGQYGRSPSTVAFYLRYLRRVCAWGTLMGYLVQDPCAGMTLPKERTPAMRVLTVEEEQRLCAMLGPPYSLWVKFAILTGLKQSEQFTLRWRDVDVEKATILLPHTTTGAATVLRLSPDAVTILRQLRAQQQPSMWVFPDVRDPYRAANVHRFYTGRWVTAVGRAGIPWCAWKDLRHTCGVRLAAQGLSADDITRLMRQRETRQAYLYRAFQRGDVRPKPKPVMPRTAVFPEAEHGELRAVLLRDLTAQPVTLGEAARLYATHHLKKRPTRVQFERMYQQFWQTWATRPMDSLPRKEVRAWYMELSETPGAANKALTLLRSLYNWAIDLELITGVNPAWRIRRFAQPSRERFLSVEELHRFMTGLGHLPAKPRTYLLVLLFTGARRSEALFMRWDDLDETTRLWRKPKTKNGMSHMVPLPIQVMEAIQALPRVSEWVFPGMEGKPWSGASVEKMWGTVRRRWGLDDVRLHDLRRSCASYLAMSGENLPTIQNVLNHRSLTPTSIYARLNTKAVDRALQAQADRLWQLAPGATNLQPGASSPPVLELSGPS